MKQPFDPERPDYWEDYIKEFYRDREPLDYIPENPKEGEPLDYEPEWDPIDEVEKNE